MPLNVPTNVRPGEIISSDLFNQILNQLALQDQRITALEQGTSAVGQVVITGTDPPNQVAAGQILTLIGQNFAFPPADNAVTVDGVSVTSFQPDSTGSMLKFIVPTSLTIPSGGRNAVIQVRNSKGTAQIVYRLLPAIPVVGSPPTITDVTTLTGTKPLRVNQPCRITGTNFAANPTDNIITFQIVTDTATVIYPKPGTSLQLDTTQTNTTQIVVTVPNITEIAAPSSHVVTVRVGVGAQVPAAFNVSVLNA